VPGPAMRSLLICKARGIARNSTSSQKGFTRNSTAPAFIARTVRRYIAVAGNEDDWHFASVSQHFLHIEPIEIRKCHIQHKAAGHGAAPVGEKLSGR